MPDNFFKNPIFLEHCQMNVLLTNDDGIDSPSLRSLYAELKKRGHEVCAIAPLAQHSGASHAVTVFKPIQARKIKEDGFEGTGIQGTPADCVKLGLGQVCPFVPDLVISGINQGPNAGPDICYSGTVAAAAEAAQHGVPAMALSHMNHLLPEDLDKVSRHAIDLAESISWKDLPKNRVININYPDLPLVKAGEIRICRRSLTPWPNEYSERKDPRGQPYWWFASTLDPEDFEEDSDRRLLAEGHITITPLQFEMRDDEGHAALEEMNLQAKIRKSR